ncbi:MAG: hypothetical protein ACYC9Q_15205, partial [Bacillota bacterium]
MTRPEDLLQELYNLRALTLNQVARLMFDGDERAAYEAARVLREKKLVWVRPVPADKRERYVSIKTATVDGYDIDPDGRKYVVPRARTVPRLLTVNEVYVQAVTAGIPRSVLIPRHEAFKRFDLKEPKLPLAWVIEVGARRYAMYTDHRKQYRDDLEKYVGKIPGGTFTGHLLFHSSPVFARRDRKRFLGESPALNFHVLTYEDMPAVKGLLLSPDGWLETLRKRLAVIAPGTRIVPSPDPRADWAMERRTKTFLADLRLGNVGTAAALNTFTDMELRQKNYEGVLYLVKDVKQAKEWGRLLGWREWHWFVAESEPVERCLFRVR